MGSDSIDFEITFAHCLSTLRIILVEEESRGLLTNSGRQFSPGFLMDKKALLDIHHIRTAGNPTCAGRLNL